MNKNNIQQNSAPVSPCKVVIRKLNPSVLAKQILIKGENRKDFMSFVAQILAEVTLSSKIEEEFLKKYIFSSWKLRRMYEIERNLLNQQQVFDERDVVFSSTKRRIRNLDRVRISTEIRQIQEYQEKLEKQVMKTLDKLRDEQHSQKIHE